MSLTGILVLLWFIPSIPLCFFRPYYGIICWTIIAFLNPQWYAWGVSELFPWALTVAIPTLVAAFLFRTDWSRVASRESLLLLILWLWFTVTMVVSSNTTTFAHHAAQGWYRWQTVSKILLMTFVTMALVNSFERLRTLLIVIGGCFGFFVAKALPWMVITGGAYKIYGPPNSMIGDNNDFGLALNMTLPVYFFTARTETNPWIRRVAAFLFVGTIPAVFFTYSRGAFLGLMAILVMMFLRLKQRFMLIPVIALALIVGALFAPDTWKKRMDFTQESSVMDNSAYSRINAWTFSWRLVSDYPIFGGGFSTFSQELYRSYAPNPGDVHGPHSIYFGVLAEHGFPGLLLYISLLISCFLTTWRVMRLAQARGDTSAVAYAQMLQFSLTGFMVSGAFLGRAYFDYYFTLVACIVVLRRVCYDAWAEEDAAEDDDSLTEESEDVPAEAGWQAI